MNKIEELFGTNVFNEKAMKEFLPNDTYESLRHTLNEGVKLDIDLADAVAKGMMEWAMKKGATHYSHWFQPLTGITAEKHEAFIDSQKDGEPIIKFSGKELIKGEPDASSFPSGGLRATFEARGYTAWDPTSYAFIKGNTLYIPTAFCSYGGHALDKKTPLLRSMKAINDQALRVLKLFGNEDVKWVRCSVGPEQEYFLITKEMFDKRPDLMLTGRTLFGAKAPKGQEMDDHYYGIIKPRVSAYMEELNEELWKLGILAKTEHNEVAPAQHELANVYTTANIATDNNQLTMEIMQKVATKHGLVCLLHEKPFAGVNGSGKHNNWSISTNAGVNLLSPGKNPYENAQFLLFLVAVIKAVDEYQDLLRISVASASNDHRLGANEAPPAIISIFLGDELTNILNAIEGDLPYEAKSKSKIKLGVDSLPTFTQDTTDRNRTSPFAFTGNKFEFRMLGSSNSTAIANVMLNSAVAEALKQFADQLETVSKEDFPYALHKLIQVTIKEHKRIIFNGNGYDDSWKKEAERRGLSNYRTTPDCIPHLLDEKNIALLSSHKVYTREELVSRCEINLENYNKILHIEALTLKDMVGGSVLPAIAHHTSKLAKGIKNKTKIGCFIPKYEVEYLNKLMTVEDEIYNNIVNLSKCVEELEKIDSVVIASEFIRDNLLSLMESTREAVDSAEAMMPKEKWPFPSYTDLLFSVK